MLGMLLQPMIFGWDAYYLPDWAYGSTSSSLRKSRFLRQHSDSTNLFCDQVFQPLQDLDFLRSVILNSALIDSAGGRKIRRAS